MDLTSFENLRAGETALRKPRHVLTAEERRRGGKRAHAKLVAAGKAHKLTAEDGRKGARAVHAYARTIGVHVGHLLTADDRRRGGLATAAKRRKERERALITLTLAGTRIGYEHEQRTGERVLKPEARAAYEASLKGPDRTGQVTDETSLVGRLPVKLGSESPQSLEPSQPLGFGTFDDPLWDLPAKREMEPNAEPEPCPVTLSSSAGAVDVCGAGERGHKGACAPSTDYELGASLAGKLMEGTVDLQLPQVVVDAFTLSALKRFKLGPKSPLSLTRSQRAQVDLMIAGGWIEATGDSMLQLTNKGWQAIEGSEYNG